MTENTTRRKMEIGQYFFIVDGTVDWFRLVLVYGIRVGIPHMVIVIPGIWDISGTVGMVAFCVIIGGLFGAVIAAWLGIRAIFYLVAFPVSCVVRRMGRKAGKV
ncbi:MAG: DUF6050 family protein [Clostridiales bacterium]|nr:DUF6050 family protein [Clostridiales bacterium]